MPDTHEVFLIRTDEKEAARIGLVLTTRAGYDPHARLVLWRKVMGVSQSGKAPGLPDPVPTGTTRAQRVEALLPTILPFDDFVRRRG